MQEYGADDESDLMVIMGNSGRSEGFGATGEHP